MLEKISKKQEKVQDKVQEKVQKQQERNDKDCRELTDEEMEQVVGGMRQTGAALKELLNRSETIPSEIVDNIQNTNQNAGSEGYSRQQVNPAAVMQGIVP